MKSVLDACVNSVATAVQQLQDAAKSHNDVVCNEQKDSIRGLMTWPTAPWTRVRIQEKGKTRVGDSGPKPVVDPHSHPVKPQPMSNTFHLSTRGDSQIHRPADSPPAEGAQCRVE